MHGRYERNPGRIIQLSPGDSRDLLDLQWEDEIARVICVTLVGPPASNQGVANAAVCVALVQGGAGEAVAEAEIDFGVGGVVFTVPASSIRITAEYEATFAGGERSPTVQVGAFASVGSGNRYSRLTRTRIDPNQIDPGGSGAFGCLRATRPRARYRSTSSATPERQFRPIRSRSRRARQRRSSTCRQTSRRLRSPTRARPPYPPGRGPSSSS